MTVVRSSPGSDDVFRTYLREIGMTPLLSPEEEVSLARSIRRARDLESRDGDLSAAERALLAEGESARTRFTKANLRLVVSIAKRYQHSGIPLPDLVQEGNLGLLRAIEKFDPDKGFRFSTYATHWIRQAISAATNEQGRSIRVPVHVHDLIVESHRVRRELEQRLARQPSDEEIAGAMGLPIERVRELTTYALDTVSFETPVGASGDATLSDLVPSADDVDFGAEISRGETAAVLTEAMESLTEREREILRYRFGIDDDKLHTIEEASKRFGVTRERVRQIEARALNRLRRSPMAERLREVEGRDDEVG